jgi:hypothetical protein
MGKIVAVNKKLETGYWKLEVKKRRNGKYNFFLTSCFLFPASKFLKSDV